MNALGVTWCESEEKVRRIGLKPFKMFSAVIRGGCLIPIASKSIQSRPESGSRAHHRAVHGAHGQSIIAWAARDASESGEAEAPVKKRAGRKKKVVVPSLEDEVPTADVKVEMVRWNSIDC